MLDLFLELIFFGDNLLYFMLVLIVTLSVLFILIDYKQKKVIRNQIEELANNTLELSPEEFFGIRNATFGGRGRPRYANKYNFSGVYILYNYSQDMYYVGQGKKVLDRVNSHFSGRGNGDVYADYKYGDEFSIRMIGLEESDFHNLNDLERSTIETFGAYSRGYNKTRGNKR